MLSLYEIEVGLDKAEEVKIYRGFYNQFMSARTDLLAGKQLQKRPGKIILAAWLGKVVR